MQKSDTRQKINFLADNSSRFQPTNNNIFSPLKRTFAIRQRLESLTVQVFLQEVYWIFFEVPKGAIAFPLPRTYQMLCKDAP
ncbi:MAG: hypothetical protein KME21_07890 [Desmonostoc vinosum HA7617-LM4]|nr:hypothetical protein [Desmonostoc vinosum HA7617-LM4]